MPSGGKELHCTLWRRLFDACLVALESISPGQRIYYGTLRCRTLPSKENFPKQRLLPWFFATDFSLALTVAHFPSHQGARPELPVTALNIFIKIPSHLNRERIYMKMSSTQFLVHGIYVVVCLVCYCLVFCVPVAGV